MKITISGASGVGKTTLAKWISEAYRLPFLELSGKPLWSSWGITNHKELIAKTIKDQEWGLAFQYQLLEHRQALILDHEFFIADRGVLDSWVYFIAQVGPFISHRACDKFCTAVLEVNTLIDKSIYMKPVWNNIVEDDGKRITNEFYQESIDALFDYYLKKLPVPGSKILKLHSNDFEHKQTLVRKWLK